MKSVNLSDGYLVRCDIGEELVSTLAGFAAKNNIQSGTVMGIGAVKNVVLGYFNPTNKEYQRKELDNTYELLSLSGNFARKDNETILHCHAAISDYGFEVFGGHLFSAVVAVTGEFYIRPGGIEVNRAPDKSTGLNLINL